MKVFIVIVSYNAMPWLEKCLNSCKGQSIIIIDNNSTDGTVAFIKQKYPEMHLLPQKENLGFGQANNIGIKYALDKGAEYVFLLNQDAYLQKDCLEVLLKTHQNYPQFGVLNPIHLNGTGDKLDENFSYYVGYKNNSLFYSDFILKKTLQDVYEVPFVNAAGWLLSKEILETVGGFDPLFFHYGEDDNFCQRVRYHGYNVGIVPTAFLNHDREERYKEEIKHGSEEYFELMERNLKMRYANINEENLGKLYKLLKRRQKNRQRALIKLNFSNASYLKKEIDLLKQIIPQIEKSRQNTMQKGVFAYL